MLLDGVWYLQMVASLVPGIVQVEEVNIHPAAINPCKTATLGCALHLYSRPKLVFGNKQKIRSISKAVTDGF
jgi:hypothetical protein